MAVNANPQPRVGLFSNPQAVFNGAPAGDVSNADNSRTLRNRAIDMQSLVVTNSPDFNYFNCVISYITWIPPVGYDNFELRLNNSYNINSNYVSLTGNSDNGSAYHTSLYSFGHLRMCGDNGCSDWRTKVSNVCQIP